MNIKQRVNEINVLIKGLELERGGLRKACKHPNKKEGEYAWRLGSTCQAIFCEDCGEILYSDIRNTFGKE